MAWIYLAESEASALPSEITSQQSPTVNETDTLSLCSCRECFLMTLTERQSGMTLHRLNQPCYQTSISSLEASPAKISVLQEMERDWTESEAVFSLKLSDLQKKLTLRLCSLKTYQQLELEDFEKSSEHLPKSGMIVGGRVYLPQVLEPHIKGNDGSCWLTPRASDVGSGEKQETFLKRMGDRTDRCAQSLAAQVKNPRTWPTPQARSAPDCSAERKRNTPSLEAQVNVIAKTNGGQLNPMWVEWLMGYPSEWTALDALVTLWFRIKSKKRLKS